jgi:hypothetical protein
MCMPGSYPVTPLQSEHATSDGVPAPRAARRPVPAEAVREAMLRVEYLHSESMGSSESRFLRSQRGLHSSTDSRKCDRTTRGDQGWDPGLGIGISDPGSGISDEGFCGTGTGFCERLVAAILWNCGMMPRQNLDSAPR